MNYRFLSLLCAATVAGTLSAPAALITTHTDSDLLGATADGTLSANEYGTGNAYSYSGGGSGFGGPLGGGTLYLNSDASKLYLGFQLGAALGDDIVIYLDTKPGGFTDATMNDLSDGGRNVVSNLGAAGNETFPFQADYAILFGSGFNMVLFELTGNGTNLNYIANNGTTGSFRESSFDLSSIGVAPGDTIDFFAALCAESAYLSNESLPGGLINLGDNPGQSSPGTYENFDRFNVVPEPGSVLALGVTGLAALLRRRRRH